MFEKIYEPVIEFGFSIKQSKFFAFYTGILVLLGLSLILMAYRKLKIRGVLRQEVKGSAGKSYCKKMSILEYERRKRELTRSELKNL
jgi:hypothetical protein